tara:strand:- start:86 stop:544 length:459 start_codon:yes stop_codon:yes gene_type:complete
MNKILKIIFIIFLFSSCSYQPILLKKNYNFSFEKIEAEGVLEINNIMKNYFSEQVNNESKKKFDLYISSIKNKEIVSSNSRGDPTIYKLNIILDYSIKDNGEVILSNKILKQATYNNINDKFELLKYEENIEKNLSESLANDILISATLIEK